MFVDEVQIKVIAWKWWDWIVSWRREKYIPKGWPYGWDGGKWWNIIFQANPNINTLSEFRHKKVLKSEKWWNGRSQCMHWANWVDLVIQVPVGTLIRDPETDEILHDLSSNFECICLARWWRGGYGNTHFATSIRQAPYLRELWDIGEELDVKLELKLVADIWIIWIPSAWKSTLISIITDVKPKIWDYPFTTLVPNLWVMEHKDKTLVLEDVPWLIPWAHEGKWLWIQFLKHIERTRVIIHLLDVYRLDKIFQDYEDLRNELELFSKDLIKKEELIIFAKTDIIEDDILNHLQEEFLKKFPGKNILTISSVTDAWIPELKDYLVENFHIDSSDDLVLDPDSEEVHYDLKEFNDAHDYELENMWDWIVKMNWDRIEQIVRMTDFDLKEWEYRLFDVLHKIWAMTKIEKYINDKYWEIDESNKILIWEKELSFVRARMFK